MSFNNTYRQVMAWDSASRAWIALHRLVEAYARTFGVGFRVDGTPAVRRVGVWGWRNLREFGFAFSSAARSKRN